MTGTTQGVALPKSARGQFTKADPSPVEGTCRISIDGRTIDARAGDRLIDVAAKAGITIPAMCHDPRMKPTGECRLCLVSVAGLDEPVKACMAVAADGMDITTQTDALNAERRGRLNTYLSNHNAYCQPPCQSACPAGICANPCRSPHARPATRPQSPAGKTLRPANRQSQPPAPPRRD